MEKIIVCSEKGTPLYTHYGKVSFFGFVAFSGRKYKAKVNKDGEWYIIINN
jgi:hypothetical protein